MRRLDARNDAMIVEWDVGIETSDGIVLRADVFRPEGQGRYPVLMTCGPYGKGLSFQQSRPAEWEELIRRHPDVLRGSNNRYQTWELPDPERWVPRGYGCVRVDSRGSGRSPGRLDPLSPREIDDFCECIEWVGGRPWSNGKVGLLGISYYAITQWLVAARQPAHLAAICPWEGGVDFYRDLTRHGGILSRFWAHWYERRVLPVQHGQGERSPRSDFTGELVAGPDTLEEDVLRANRIDLVQQLRDRPLLDQFYLDRTPELERILVPVLSAGNWGGQGLHLRGNVEGFQRSSSCEKWLEVHGGPHWGSFYAQYGCLLQAAFFDHFLKGEDNGWGRKWRVLLQARTTSGGYVERRAQKWPLEGTRWRKWYLHPRRFVLQEGSTTAGSEEVVYDVSGPGLVFVSQPLGKRMTIIGPSAVKLYVSTTAADVDLFLVGRIFDSDGNEVVFDGAQDRHVPMNQGWLRLSHRRLEETQTEEWRPFHRHRYVDLVEPGTIYEVDVELWPTSVVVPKGYRVALSVRCRDYQYVEVAAGDPVRLMNGCGRCTHDDPCDWQTGSRGTVSVHGGPGRASYLLLPDADAVV